MIVKVYMLAHEKRLADNGVKVREVNVPEEKITGRTRVDLEKVYRYGQNDFQRQDCCSVSCGDVAHLDGKLWLCATAGWREITRKQYEELTNYDQRNLSLHYLVTGRPYLDPSTTVRMFEKGYKLILVPQDRSMAPLYVKFANEVARVLREDFPEKTFDIYQINEETISELHRIFNQMVDLTVNSLHVPFKGKMA